MIVRICAKKPIFVSLASLLLCLVSPWAMALCVSTSAELQQALTDYSDGGVNSGQPIEIDVVQGTYKTGNATNHLPFTYVSHAASGQLILVGGWKANCGGFSRDASLTILDGNHATQVLNINNHNNLVYIVALTIQNGETTAIGGGVSVNAGGDGAQTLLYQSIVRNNHTTNVGGGIAVYGSGDNQLVVYGDLITGNSADMGYGAGIIGGRSIRQIELQRSTIYQNTTTVSGGTGGLSCCETTSTYPPEIIGNIMLQNTNYALRLTGTPVEMDYNDYGAITGVTPDTNLHSTSADPLFVNAAQNDFHLKSGSPLLGYVGGSYSNLGYDLEGNSIPQSGFVDGGAYEDTTFIDGFE